VIGRIIMLLSLIYAKLGICLIMLLMKIEYHETIHILYGTHQIQRGLPPLTDVFLFIPKHY
jgi:hypothetical protein